MSRLNMQERLSAYLDGDLSPGEMKEVAEHLRGCESCQTVLLELRQVRDELRSLPEVQVPADLHSSIMEHLRPQMKRKKWAFLRFDLKSWGYRQWIPVTAAMMVLVMFLSVGGVMWYSNRFGGSGFDSWGAKPRETAYSSDRAVGGVGSVSKSEEMAAVSPSAPPVDPDASFSIQAEAKDSAPGTVSLMMAPAGGSEPVVDTSRKIIRRAQLAVEVTRGEVKPASVQAVNAIQSNFGYVETSSTSQTDNDRKEITSFFMVARVPAENFDKAVQDLTALGRTTREDITAQDITDTYVDLDARLRNKENQESRLLQIMGEAKTVGEILQVEGELSRVRGDIESMRAQKMNYDKSVAMSTVTLTIAEEGATRPIPSPWSEVWRVFVESWRRLAVFAANVAPGLIVLAVLAAGGLWAVRRRRA
ncbi:MAG: DUF4349 domain-containing protein [Bacillota bacterium]|jgi:hypothetical protein|nr:DUF4349 domain-containing protein [Candidatus Fermentithermobacillaceae bacterium]